MRVALDTNRYVDLRKGVAETVELLESCEEVLLPFVVLGELRAGFAHGRRAAENGATCSVSFGPASPTGGAPRRTSGFSGVSS